MNWKKLLNSLQLNHDQIFNKKIQPHTRIDTHAVIYDRQRQFLFEL